MDEATFSDEELEECAVRGDFLTRPLAQQALMARQQRRRLQAELAEAQDLLAHATRFEWGYGNRKACVAVDMPDRFSVEHYAYRDVVSTCSDGKEVLTYECLLERVEDATTLNEACANARVKAAGAEKDGEGARGA